MRGFLELVVCPNTNDAQIYQYGHSNSKLESTLKGVSIDVSIYVNKLYL
jgi:hypothetical protein